MNKKKIHELSERLKELKESHAYLEFMAPSKDMCVALSALENNIITTTKELYKAQDVDYFPTAIEDGGVVMYLLFRKGGLEPVVARLDPSVAATIKEAKITLFASSSGRSWFLAAKETDGTVFRVARTVKGITDPDKIVLPKNEDVFDCRLKNLEETTRSDATRKRVDENGDRENGIQKVGEKYRVNVYVPDRGCAVYGGLHGDIKDAREARDGILDKERADHRPKNKGRNQ